MGQELRRFLQGGPVVTGSISENCGALIYSTSTKRYLFLLRNSKQSGTWGLVGGKVEAGETVITALMREMHEEIGGTIRDPKFIPIEKFTSDNKKFVYHTFVCPVDYEFVPELNTEHRGYCWVKLNDHPKPLHPGVWKTFRFDVVKNKLAVLEKTLSA